MACHTLTFWRLHAPAFAGALKLGYYRNTMMHVFTEEATCLYALATFGEKAALHDGVSLEVNCASLPFPTSSESLCAIPFNPCCPLRTAYRCCETTNGSRINNAGAQSPRRGAALIARPRLLGVPPYRYLPPSGKLTKGGRATWSSKTLFFQHGNCAVLAPSGMRSASGSGSVEHTLSMPKAIPRSLPKKATVDTDSIVVGGGGARRDNEGRAATQSSRVPLPLTCCARAAAGAAPPTPPPTSVEGPIGQVDVLRV